MACSIHPKSLRDCPALEGYEAKSLRDCPALEGYSAKSLRDCPALEGYEAPELPASIYAGLPDDIVAMIINMAEMAADLDLHKKKFKGVCEHFDACLGYGLRWQCGPNAPAPCPVPFIDYFEDDEEDTVFCVHDMKIHELVPELVGPVNELMAQCC